MTRLVYIAGLIVIVLAGCASSPPVQVLTLDPLPVASAAGGHQQRSTASSTWQIARVHVPPSLDRQQIVRETSPNVLDVSDQHRWSAPLDRMIETVLTLDLANQLPALSVLPSRSPATSSTRKVVISIERFLELPDRAVELKGAWSWQSGDDDHYCTQLLNLTTTAKTADYPDQAKAMSMLISQLSAQIAAVSRTPAAEDACPSP